MVSGSFQGESNDFKVLLCIPVVNFTVPEGVISVESDHIKRHYFFLVVELYHDDYNGLALILSFMEHTWIGIICQE